MKKYSIILSAVLSIFALASCQKEQDIKEQDIIQEEVKENVPSSVPFVLRANIPSVDTKTTLNTSTWAVNWESTDVIYAVTTDKAWGQDYKDDNSGETIADFAYDSESGTFSTDKAISDGNHTFNFLYSAGDQRSFHRGGSTTFQLAGTQTFDASAPTANLKTYDALAAQVVATTPTSFADVEMSHLFSLMKVTLKNKTGDAVNITKFEIEIPDENLYGIFNVIFGATPSTTLKSGQGDKITVNISNGTVAADGTLDVYFVMAPVAGYTGEVTFTVTDSESNTYTKTNTISAPGVTFAAGTYNTANFSLKVAAPLYPTIDTSSSDYTTGFETGFTTGNTYNNTTVKVDGPDGGKWGSYFGTASTSDKITGSNSMQMRWYTSSSSSLGYAESNFFLSNVGFVSFNAKQTNELKVGLYYKRASDGDWVLAQTFEPGTASTKCSYAFVTPIENARIKFGIVLPAKAPTGTSKLTIDDVVVKRVAPSYTVTIDGGITHGTVSTSPSGSVLEGAEVTITATPEDGYALTSLSVTDALSQAVTVTANKFTMPGSNVTVTATFAKLYAVTWSAPSNGSITVKHGETILSSGNTVPEGATVTITTTPADGYALSTLKYNDGSDHDIKTSKSFTMPSNDVSISATFESGSSETMTFSDLYNENTALDGVTINGTNFSVVFNKRDGGTATQYYTNGTAVRWYGGGSLVVTAKGGKTITGITLSFGGTKGNAITAGTGSYTDGSANGTGTWSGSASSVTFTQAGTSGHDRISAITVTYTN